MLWLFILLIPSGALAKGFGDVGTQGQWNSANHPKIFFNTYEDHFELLPLEGSFEPFHDFWSDDYWPKYQGGIAYRWQSFETPRQYQFFTPSQARQLSKQQILGLSPAEKWDLLHNDFRFRFAKHIKRKNPGTASTWEGLCHGWAEANLNLGKLQVSEYKNRQGQVITLFASDKAALASYFYGKLKRGGRKFLGQRCYQSGSNHTACRDMNPGAFHIVLAESLKRKRSFIVDIEPERGVWNHPIESFKISLLGQREPSSGSASGTVREYLIENELGYLSEGGTSRRNPPMYIEIKELNYWLELNADNRIIGGSWQNRPQIDFAWSSAPAKLSKKYQILLNK